MNRKPVNVEVVETVSRQYVFMDESHKLEVLGAEEVETRRFNQPGFTESDRVALSKTLAEEKAAQERVLANLRVNRVIYWAGSLGVGLLASVVSNEAEIAPNIYVGAAAGTLLSGAFIAGIEAMLVRERVAINENMSANRNMQQFITNHAADSNELA